MKVSAKALQIFIVNSYGLLITKKSPPENQAGNCYEQATDRNLRRQNKEYFFEQTSVS